MKIITSFQTLVHYAKKLGEARKHGTPEEIEEAQRQHDAYYQACLRSDEILTGFTQGYLSAGAERREVAD